MDESCSSMLSRGHSNSAAKWSSHGARLMQRTSYGDRDVNPDDVRARWCPKAHGAQVIWRDHADDRLPARYEVERETLRRPAWPDQGQLVTAVSLARESRELVIGRSQLSGEPPRGSASVTWVAKCARRRAEPLRANDDHFSSAATLTVSRRRWRSINSAGVGLTVVRLHHL